MRSYVAENIIFERNSFHQNSFKLCCNLMSSWLNTKNMKDLFRLEIKLLLVLHVSVGCLSQTPRLNQDEMKDLREESLNETSSDPTKSPSSEEEEEHEHGGEDEIPSNHTRIPSSGEETEPEEDDASSHLTASIFLLVTCLTLYATTSLILRYD